MPAHADDRSPNYLFNEVHQSVYRSIDRRASQGTAPISLSRQLRRQAISDSDRRQTP
jgi:hypothetical protein